MYVSYDVYAVSVSMAYFLGPLLGGEISQYIGFSWLMSIIGLANIIYGIYLMKTELLVHHSQVRWERGLIATGKLKMANISKRLFGLFFSPLPQQSFSGKDSAEDNNKFYLRLWPSNTTLSSNSSFKRFYDTVDKSQQ